MDLFRDDLGAERRGGGDNEDTSWDAIWDSGDGTNDSTALFDDFVFATAASSPGMSTVPQ